MLESILALYRPQRNALSKAYSLPVYTKKKKSILSIYPVYSSNLNHTQREKKGTEIEAFS